MSSLKEKGNRSMLKNSEENITHILKSKQLIGTKPTVPTKPRITATTPTAMLQMETNKPMPIYDR